MENQLQTDVVVVGGGLVGAATALSLRLQGKDVILVEAGSPKLHTTQLYSGWDERIYAISPVNQAFLHAMKAWPENNNRMQNVLAMNVQGDAGGQIAFDCEHAHNTHLAVIVENRYLLASIWKRLQEEGVSILQNVRGSRIQTDPLKAYLSLDNHQQIEANLIVGADGANSWVRKELGIEIKINPYSHYGVVANFECEKNHHGVAYQWFDKGEILAYLPLPDNRMSMVWSTREPQSLMALDDEALAQRVAKRGRHTLGALSQLTPASAFELRLICPKSTTRERVVLVGDAAHTVHPLAGQGVNLGFGDVMVLSKILKNETDIGHSRVLRAYALRRIEPVRLMQSGCDGLFKLFETRNIPGIGWVRNKGLSLVNKSERIKKRLIRQAMGW